MIVEDADHITLPAAPPRRDRRIIMVAGLVLVAIVAAFLIVGYSLHSVSSDRDGWKAVAIDLRVQLDQQSVELLCRSQANLDSDRAAAELAIATADALTAAGRQEPLDPVLIDMANAADTLRAALKHRQVSLDTCTIPTTGVTP